MMYLNLNLKKKYYKKFFASIIPNYLLKLLHEIWLTLISHVLVVDVVVEKVKASVTESVAALPMSM